MAPSSLCILPSAFCIQFPCNPWLTSAAALRRWVNCRFLGSLIPLKRKLAFARQRVMVAARLSRALRIIDSGARLSAESELWAQWNRRGGCQIEAELVRFLLSFPRGGALSPDAPRSADIPAQCRQDLTLLIPEGCPKIAQHFNVGYASLAGHKSRRDG